LGDGLGERAPIRELRAEVGLVDSLNQRLEVAKDAHRFEHQLVGILTRFLPLLDDGVRPDAIAQRSDLLLHVRAEE